MRHFITVAFLLAALVAYWASFNPALPGAIWLAGALFGAGLLCELTCFDMKSLSMPQRQLCSRERPNHSRNRTARRRRCRAVRSRSVSLVR
jgi:hypothetical protein